MHTNQIAGRGNFLSLSVPTATGEEGEGIGNPSHTHLSTIVRSDVDELLCGKVHATRHDVSIYVRHELVVSHNAHQTS